MTTVKFPDPPNTPVLTLRSILQGRPVLFVEHDENGGWRFFDGSTVFAGHDLVLVPLGRLLELHPSIGELAGLPVNWRARRCDAETSWEPESSQTLERTRARTAEALKAMQRGSVTLPPGSPSTSELLREGRQ